MHLAAVRHDRDVAALALHIGHTQRDAHIAGWHRAGHRRVPVQHHLLDEQHRVVVEDRAEQQTLRVGRGGRHDHLDTRRVHGPRLEHLAVLGAEATACAGRGADDHRHSGLPTAHVADLAGVVADLVEAHGEEVHDHDLGDGPVAGDGRTDGGADDGLLADGGLAHTMRAVLGGQALGDLVDATRRLGDVFTEHDDLRVDGHGDVERLVDGQAGHQHGELGSSGVGHDWAPPGTVA